MLATRTNSKTPHISADVNSALPAWGEGDSGTAPSYLALTRNFCPAVDERWRSALMAPELARWAARAVDQALTEGQRTYAATRARAIGRPMAPRIERCGRAGSTVACDCPGSARKRSFGCRQWLFCRQCRAQRQPRLAMRIRKGLDARFAEAKAAWDDTYEGRPRLVLLTLTVRHSGDLSEDRRALAEGWRKFYLSLNDEIGKWHYVAVWEVTPSDGGHVHMHVACVWPWLPWGVEQQNSRRAWNVREKWLAACPESERITLVASRRDGKPSTGSSVGNYLSKYLAKGSCTSSMYTPQMRAEIAAATYNKRSVTPSVGFWEPFIPLCRCCGAPWRVQISPGHAMLLACAWPVSWDAVPDWERQLEEPMGQLQLNSFDTEPW